MTDYAIQNPFDLLTLIVAPALLTHARTVLAGELETVTALQEADWLVRYAQFSPRLL